jgi:hypothetical protein
VEEEDDVDIVDGDEKSDKKKGKFSLKGIFGKGREKLIVHPNPPLLFNKLFWNDLKSCVHKNPTVSS